MFNTKSCPSNLQTRVDQQIIDNAITSFSDEISKLFFCLIVACGARDLSHYSQFMDLIIQLFAHLGGAAAIVGSCKIVCYLARIFPKVSDNEYKTI